MLLGNNAGLRAAWDMVSEDMKKKKPKLAKFFKEIDGIRWRVSPA